MFGKSLITIVLIIISLSIMATADPIRDLPASFDLRNYNGADYVTSIKSQQGGTCWTHGVMASMESNLLMTGNWALAGETGEPNLAEYHLDWWNGFNQHNNDDTDPPTGGGLTVHEGGDYLVASAYITRGEGAVRDIDGQLFDYPPARYQPSYHIYYARDIEWYVAGENLENIDLIKQKVMSEGAVGTCMCYDGSFMYTGYIHYQPSASSWDPNHAIAIVGWDDNKSTPAPQPGAWLCKNSWGSGFGYNGYFWISYFDKHAGQHPEMGAVSYQEVMLNPYDYTYFHDYHGWRDTKTDCSEAFNAFTAREYHQIEAVGFYTSADNVTYTAKIYDAFEAGELTGELASATGTIAYIGYHTVDLDLPVIIESGDDFYVYVQLSSGGQAYDRTSVVPVLLGANYRTEVISAAWPGESYYREGGQWYDFYDLDTTANFCIKALAVEPASLDFEFPNGRPQFVTPGLPTTFEVRIIETGDSYVPGTGTLYYRNHDSAYMPVPLVNNGGDIFEATLPAANRGSIISYYIGADAVSAGTVYSPSKAPTEVYTCRPGNVVDMLADHFESDQGWTVWNDPDLTSGAWERGIPVGGGDRGDPASDYDGSGYCYLTGNWDGDSDVDDGSTYLISPTLDLSAGDGLIEYARWYCNDFGSSPHSDVMRIQISSDNGYNWTVVDLAGPERDASGGWNEFSFRAGDYIQPGSQVKLRFGASDLGDSSIVEAGLDDFALTTYNCDVEPLVIVTDTLPDWTAGHPYNQFLEAYGGIGTYRWMDIYLDLEGTGLALSLYGSLAGTPQAAGEVSFTTMLADEGDNSVTRTYSFHINEAVAVTTESLPDWTAGVPYSAGLTAAGGTGGIVWADRYGDLTGTGLTLNTDGLLSGTPIAGAIDFTAEASDDVGASDEHLYGFTINPAVDITGEAVPACIVGEAYACTLACTGGTGTLTWSDRDGDLSGTGLSLSPDGVLSGMLDHDTIFVFTARVIDEPGSVDEQMMTVESVSPWICGDANDDSEVNVGDAVYLINYVFNSGPAPAVLCAADANGDDAVDVGDAVYLINYVFKEGPPPVEPCCP